MGWTGIFDAIRKSNGQIDRKSTLEREFAGWKHATGETVMLKGSMAGSVFYAAMQTTTQNGVDVWALVVLTGVNGGEFRYKEMTEDEHPYYFSCPISILNALTPTTNENANAWRQKCMEEYSKKKTTAGRIPRNATQLYITFLVDTSASKKGYSTMIYKSNGKWIYKDENGRLWRVCASMLRNSDIIQVNGTEEPKNAPTGEETPEPVQNTTTPENEPENGTQTAKTTDMETFKKEYSRIYSHLYEHEGQPGVDAARRKYSRLFDESWEDIKDIAKAFCTITGDLLTSDRQCAAFMIALDKVGTPTAPQNAPQGVESTTGDQTPTYGHKTPYGATDEATTGEATTDGKKITTDGTTDETTPASDPRQPDGNTITGGSTPNGNEITSGSRDGNTITGNTDGGNRITYGATTTPPRTACENDPQRTETGEGIETSTPRHKTPSRGKYKATHARPPKFGKICAGIRVPSGALFSAGAG